MVITQSGEVKVYIYDESYVDTSFNVADIYANYTNGSSDKITKGQLKLSHFAVDGELSYHYYEVLNVRTPRTKK